MQTDLNEAKERELAMEASDRALSVVKDTSVSMEDTGKIEILTAEVEHLKVILF